MSTHLVFVHALSPIHCGTGQAISGIDLPVAREKPTGIPLVPGSSLKGVLRAQPRGFDAERKPAALHLAAFGPETDNASEYAGAVQFGDANLLFLPIRSVRGTFGWVTSPYMLRRFTRDLRECNLKWPTPSVDAIKDTEAFVTSQRLIVRVGNNESVVFEDFDFVANSKVPGLLDLANKIGERLFADAPDRTFFAERVCVVSDDVMRVLSRVGMEVVARNRIDNESKTVAKGALWTEEALPVESILAGLVVATPVRRGDDSKKLIEHVRGLCSGSVQIGGKATVGRGLCKVEVI